MAPTFAAGVVAIIAQILAWLNIDIGIDALNTTITTIVTIAMGFFVLYRQVKTGKATKLGTRPK